MADLIDRQDALKCLEVCGNKKTLDEVYERLSNLPSVKPAQTETCEDTISRQAAIDFLKKPLSNACMMEYLENAPSVNPIQSYSEIPNKCEDAISRKFALDLCYKKGTKIGMWQDLYELPSVQPVQKVGKWIITDYEYYDCSVCGESYYNGCESEKEAEERLKMRRPYDVYSFCPYCGAKMEEGE